MPASSEAIRRERIMADDGRTLDFRVSVAPGHAVAISRRQAGFTDSPRGGWVSVWEHLVMHVASVIADGLPGPGMLSSGSWPGPSRK